MAYKYLGGEILCAETAGDKYGDFEQSFAIIQQRKLNAGRSYMHVLFTRCGSTSSYRELWEGITASWPGTRFILVNSPLDEPLFDFLEPASRATRTIHPGLDLYFAQPRRAAERIGSDVFDGIVNGACTSDLLKRLKKREAFVNCLLSICGCADSLTWKSPAGILIPINCRRPHAGILHLIVNGSFERLEPPTFN